MDPHVLQHLVARDTGQTMAELTLRQHLAPSRPRKPRTTFGWPGRRR